MAQSRRGFCWRLGAIATAALLGTGVSLSAAALVPNVRCTITGTSLAPNAQATATLTLVNKQPTFQITGNTFTPYANKTLTLEIVRGSTKLLLTRVTVDAAGNISRSLRAPATTIRVGDVLQLTFEGAAVARGTVRQGRI